MHFKHSVLLMTVFLLLATGCENFLRSSKSDAQRKSQSTVSLKPKGLECLNGLPDQLRQYLHDESSPEQIGSVFKCADTALTSFVLYYEVKDPNRYTAEELRHFFNRYMLKENEISPDFMVQIMKLKSFLVGGSEDFLGKDEIEVSRQILQTIGDEARSLSGDVGYLTFQRSADHAPSLEEGSALKMKVKQSFLRISSQSKAASSNYEFADLMNFVGQLEAFTKDADTLKPFVKWMPMLQSVKNLFWGDHATTGSAREWTNSLSWILDGYFLGLDYKTNFEVQGIQTPGQWQRMTVFIDGILTLAEQAPVLVAGGTLEVRNIDSVIDDLASMHLIPSHIPPALVKKTYQMAILRFLERNGNRNLEPEDVVKGIDSRHLGILRYEYNVWRNSEDSILRLFQGRAANELVTPAQIRQQLDQQDVSQLGQGLRGTDSQSDSLADAWNDWKALLENDRPLQWTLNHQILMPADPNKAGTSFIGLNIMNGLRTISRLVLRGYGEDPTRGISSLKMTVKGMNDLESDFREIGQTIGFLDPRSQNPAQRTFREASLFPYHGRGQDQLNETEILEELSLLISGGAVAAVNLEKASVAAGCKIGVDPTFGKDLMNETCYKQVFLGQMPTVLSAMPGMRDEFISMNAAQKDTFYQSLMSVAVVEPKLAGTIEFAEMRNALVILHYVESLISVYDLNHDGHFSEQEISAAAPRFRQFISEVSPLKDYFVDDIFLCMVYKAKKPSSVDLVKFKVEKQFGLRDITRLDLVKVLAILKKDAIQ